MPKWLKYCGVFVFLHWVSASPTNVNTCREGYALKQCWMPKVYIYCTLFSYSFSYGKSVQVVLRALESVAVHKVLSHIANGNQSYSKLKIEKYSWSGPTGKGKRRLPIWSLAFSRMMTSPILFPAYIILMLLPSIVGRGGLDEGHSHCELLRCIT